MAVLRLFTPVRRLSSIPGCFLYTSFSRKLSYTACLNRRFSLPRRVRQFFLMAWSRTFWTPGLRPKYKLFTLSFPVGSYSSHSCFRYVMLWFLRIFTMSTCADGAPFAFLVTGFAIFLIAVGIFGTGFGILAAGASSSEDSSSEDCSEEKSESSTFLRFLT